MWHEAGQLPRERAPSKSPTVRATHVVVLVLLKTTARFKVHILDP